MIEYHYESDFKLKRKSDYTDWLTRVIKKERASHNQIDYIFCSDEYLLKINQEHLNHDTFTDIITFDYSKGKELAADIFISVDRVKENAEELGEDFRQELLRVMVHGILHLLGYNDKTDREASEMRQKENEMIELFHVEQ